MFDREMVREDRLRLMALCAVDGVTGKQWEVIARQGNTPTGLRELLEGQVRETTGSARQLRENLDRGLTSLDKHLEFVEDAVVRAEDIGARLITVLDSGYPVNLRRIHNRPPFLFVLGELHEDDIRSIAVVGTRRATELGLRQSQKMATRLSERGVTVVSGMAAGIDTAAHEATLAVGGRTIAVMGTGILRIYPKQNEALKQRIAESGAVVSQFWPDQHPSRHTFPIRNVVTSGISQGTVVIEASKTSGAKMQARLATEHGKRVFLLHSLVTSEDWAQQYVEERNAVEVMDVEDVMRRLSSPDEVLEATELREQLAIEFA